ncbi:hypothetical protein PGAL8A_00012100 [Plasmodium gallinaceum]|uniref:Uncharacterized protein n=1 Tax=Plasmodium gallinaceum TaxID=5849 RepID=A0A1J1GSX4_PLAGA|nr:hypothetical protein PGAL8A_00012100 [Plasmodium gallinaceum]CRG95352.1 hypothetical protein PGAL8A_00012100 [Plasmodium gallinaceum]
MNVKPTESYNENLRINEYDNIQNDKNNNSINLNKKDGDNKIIEDYNSGNSLISYSSKNKDQVESQKKRINVSSITISDEIENMIKEKSINTEEKSKTSYDNLNKNKKKNSKSSSDKLIKNIVVIGKSKTTPDKLYKNTNTTNKLKTTFSDQSYEQSKNKIKALKTIHLDKSFLLKSNIFSNNNKGASDDFFKNDDFITYSSDCKTLPTVNEEKLRIKSERTKKLIFQKNKKINRLAYSLDISKYNLNEKKKLTLKKCNSTYFNKRGIILYF